MITFSRILFPVDFSARCAAAVPSVQTMAKRFGSAVTVMHIVDLPPAGIAPPEAVAWATLVGANRLREQGTIALEHFISQHFPGMPITAETAEGDAASMIVDYANHTGADLIMLPTSGIGRFRRLLLGSVTAKVLHDTTVPVWTGVHAEEIAAHVPDRWRSMLCALDDQAESLPVLQWAAQFAAEQKLELRLVHAVSGPPQECEDNPKFRQFLFDVARESIDKLQGQAGTNLELCLHVGEPARIVRQAAIGHCADMVVIGRGVLQKTLGRLRSAAYEIIREAPCPVISV
jgi:nucleotide-binding universal stress UspA family protein